MVKVQFNNTNHITIANIYIPPQDRSSTHNKTADTDTQTPHTIHHKHTTHSPHRRCEPTVHREQLIADATSKSDHITQTHQPECQTPHYNKLFYQISPHTVHNTLYTRTSWTTQPRTIIIPLTHHHHN